jgi:hypothetical protein
VKITTTARFCWPRYTAETGGSCVPFWRFMVLRAFRPLAIALLNFMRQALSMYYALEALAQGRDTATPSLFVWVETLEYWACAT